MKFEVCRTSYTECKEKVVEINTIEELIDFFKKAEKESADIDEDGFEDNNFMGIYIYESCSYRKKPDDPVYTIEIVDDYLC